MRYAIRTREEIKILGSILATNVKGIKKLNNARI